MTQLVTMKRWQFRSLVALLCAIAVLATTLVFANGEAAAQAAPPASAQTDMAMAVTCLAGNGRVDINLVNTSTSTSTYRLELGNLSPREIDVAPGDWGRLSFTGRTDGSLDLAIARNGAPMVDTQVQVQCDGSPALSSPTVQVINSCRAGNGYILFQLANNTSQSRGWVIEFDGVPNRSTTTAPFGAALRAVTGRPDNTYTAVLRSGAERIERTITVDCDADPVDPVDPVEGTELITNGDFANGETGWWSGGAAGSPDTSGGEYCVTAPPASVPWDTQIGHPGLDLIPGAEYVLSFDVRANAPASITAAVQLDGPPWTPALDTQLNVATTSNRYSYTFTGTADATDAVVVFKLGTSSERRFCFDNVSLLAVGDDPVPGLDEEANIALITNNPVRNDAFDDNQFRDVPMNQIQVSDLTVPQDLYNEGLLDTSASGYFRTKCEISHFAYDDPIVFPNQPGRAHLHMFFGNTEANAFSTFDSLLNTGTGSCNGEDLNRTSYWVPALLDSNGNALIPFEVMVYYKNDLFRLNGANELVEPFADNLRMVVGNAMSSTPQTTLSGRPGSLPIVSFNCGRPYGGGNQLEALIPDCYAPEGGNPWAGDALEMKIAFPQCHNPDNGTYRSDGSHMSYSENGYYGVRCPDSHPNDVSSIMYRIFYSPSSYGGALDDVYLSSDVRPDGTILPPGTTAHADWFGAWHPEAMETWVENCNNTQADCEIGILDRDPMTSMVRRQENTYPRGYLAQAQDLIQLCPGRVLDPNRPLESVANCTQGRMAPGN